MRAAEVCLFIQGRGIISPEKLVSIGYGQFHPIADNATSEGRAKNRRVEILLIDEGAEIRNINEYFEEYYSGANADKTIVTDGVPENIQAEQAVPEANTGIEPAVAPEGATPEGTPPSGAEAAPAGNVQAGGPEGIQENALVKDKTPQVAGVSREIPGEKEDSDVVAKATKILGEFFRGLGGKAWS